MVIKIINEFAFKRKKVMTKVESKIEDIGDHILKCILYKDSLNSLEHWKKELSDKFNVIGSYNTKSGGGLKLRDYKKLFNEYSNSKDMIRCHLIEIMSDKNKDYPYVKLTNNDLSFIEKVYNEVINKMYDMFMDNVYYDRDDYYNALNEVFDKYNIK